MRTTIIPVPSTAVSHDRTITLPTEIAVTGDGKAVGRHADSGDHGYDSLQELCFAYEIDLDDVMGWPMTAYATG